MNESTALLTLLQSGDYRALARAITLVENELPGSNELLQSITILPTPLIGITGPPGAGKSSLVNVLIQSLLSQNKKVGVVAVDPTSPFNFGSLLGDRIRLAENFSHPNLFIRSLASRGSLGGLCEKIMEVTDVMKAAGFDFLFVETVGVGQSEVEIAGLADTTVVVLNPDSGDDVQAMKAGLMEVADIFVVNKSDHAGADRFAAHLRALAASRLNPEQPIPVVKTIATTHEGTDELMQEILKHHAAASQSERRILLLTEKLLKMIQLEKMRPVNRHAVREAVRLAVQQGHSNVYLLAKQF